MQRVELIDEQDDTGVTRWSVVVLHNAHGVTVYCDEDELDARAAYEAIAALERELAEAWRQVDRVTRIGTKLQHDVAEAAGMNVLGEESACTDLVIEAVRELRRERDELDRALDEEIASRDRFADALQSTHVALGRDGEWVARPGSVCRAGETGDLTIDVPAIAQELRDAVEDEIQRRDRYRDAVTEAHVALGGDGVWRAHVGGAPEPPNSGHLHLDVPVMARGMVRERDELSDKLDETCAATADLAERLATLTRDHEALVTLYGAAKVERDELRDALAGLKAHPDTARVYLEAADEIEMLRARGQRYEKALRKIAERWAHTGASAIATEALSDD